MGNKQEKVHLTYEEFITKFKEGWILRLNHNTWSLYDNRPDEVLFQKRRKKVIYLFREDCVNLVRKLDEEKRLKTGEIITLEFFDGRRNESHPYYTLNDIPSSKNETETKEDSKPEIKEEDLNLSEEQEEALCMLYQSAGYNEALSDILSLIEKKLGLVHSLTIELRKNFSEGKALDKSRKADELIEKSKLREVLYKRLESENYK